MDKLNEFELQILERTATIYPSLQQHLPYLIVSKRDVTGVGMYVHFIYKEEIEKIGLLELNDVELGIKAHIEWTKKRFRMCRYYRRS